MKLNKIKRNIYNDITLIISKKNINFKLYKTFLVLSNDIFIISSKVPSKEWNYVIEVVV